MKKFINRAAVLVLCVWLAVQSVSAAKVLIPGGQVIGLSLQDNTVTVAAFDQQLGQAAKDAGLQVGDRIVSVDTQQVQTPEDIREILRRSDGSVEIGSLRGSKSKKFRMEPPVTEDGPRLGVY